MQRLPDLRWTGCGFVGPRKRSATGRYCADAAMPGGTAFARPTVGTMRFAGDNSIYKMARTAMILPLNHLIGVGDIDRLLQHQRHGAVLLR